MKKSIIVIIMFFGLLSCNKEKDSNLCMNQVFSFFDENGNDIFDQNLSSHLDTLALKTYTLSGEEVSNTIWKVNGVYQFNIFINNIDSTTIVKIGEITIDTISADFKEVENALFIHKVFYNGQLVMTNEESTACGSGKVVNVFVKPD